MKKLTVKGIILAGAIVVLGLTMPAVAFAGVDVNISIPLFGLFYDARPPVVIAPAPYGYAPNGYYAAPPAGAVLYGGYWYRPSGGNWFIAAQAGGPWAVIGIEQVPYAVISGPVLMGQPNSYGDPYVRSPGVGVVINPWINIDGGHGRHGGHGRGHYDD